MTRDVKLEMMDTLPLFYRGSKTVDAVIDPEAVEVAALNVAIMDVIDQLFIDSATWTLARREKIAGIQTDESKPFDQRRSVLKARIRGFGTVTVNTIKNVADAHLNGECNVVQDPANYEISVTFISTRGNPPNMADIEKAIRDIVPAHLNVRFLLTFLGWDELESNGLTFDQVEAFTWDGLETAFLN